MGKRGQDAGGPVAGQRRGHLDGAGLRIGVVASRYNDAIVTRLLEGVAAQLERLGVKSSDVVHAGVPGALEIPLALKWLAGSGRFDALVAVGVVIRGETYHFEVVANESARGVMDVALETGVPVANAILTAENAAQAEARLDKGAEAVRVAVEMARLRSGLAEQAT
ncbi:MAG: 6,7-dimethyl-8-ribityllumazine synthase [Burkholderiales bacterium]|nr:6,7-dimethyl-8-ribityllumazine synthase [Burkholderiales bacterium]